jgi:phosphoglycerate dehydrogenase-like enzyme
MKEINVLVLTRTPADEEMLDLLRAVSPRLIVTSLAGGDADKDANLWHQAEVLFTDDPLPPDGAAPNLRWVQGYYAGVDRWGRLPFTQPQMWTTTSGIHCHVAELVLTLMLAFARKLTLILDNQEKAGWPADRVRLFEPYELRDSTVGVVGYGSIGRQVGYLCRAFGMRVLAADRPEVLQKEPEWKLPGTPSVSEAMPDRLYDPSDLKFLMQESDYVVLSLPYTPDTHHMISAAILAAMKPTGVLINVARGSVVDESALIEALRERKIRGAGLDVYSREPLPASSPFWHMPNVIASPHVAGFSPHYLRRAMTLFAENLRRYIAGEPLLNLVQKERGY